MPLTRTHGRSDDDDGPYRVPNVGETLYLIAHELAHLREQLHNDVTREYSPSLDWSIGPVTNKSEKQSTTMDLKLTTDQQVTVTIKPQSAKGKPVKIDGAPVWSVTAGSCTVDTAPDGMSAVIVSSDDAGDSEVTVSADADLGAGVITISDAIRVTVLGAQAQSLGLTAGVPENKP